MSKEGSLDAPIRHAIDFEHPDFLNPEKLDAEMRRAFDRQYCSSVCQRPCDRRVCYRAGSQIRHHFCRVTDEIHSNVESRRSDRLPRRSHVAGCPESRRCRS